jgi:hypothetical protein
MWKHVELSVARLVKLVLFIGNLEACMACLLVVFFFFFFLSHNILFSLLSLFLKKKKKKFHTKTKEDIASTLEESIFKKSFKIED